MLNKIYDNIKNYIKENWRFLIFLVFFIAFFSIETNYSIFKPGGTIDISKRIQGNELYQSKGSFNMAYVGMVKGKLPYYLLAQILPSWELVKNEDIIYNDEEDIADTLKRDHIYYEQAIKNAEIVAYTHAGINYKITNEKNYAVYITKENNSELKIGDEIISYDENKYLDLVTIIEYVQTKNINDTIKIEYIRDGIKKITYATVYEEEGINFIGLSVVKLFDIETPHKITIDTKKGESGPSGGLMLSLAIYDALTKEDLTKGKKIVGTGTINEKGEIGEIGSVVYKLDAAVKDKADIFLCPKNNYEESKKHATKQKYDIMIYGVDTFEEGLNVLKNRRNI